MADDSSSVGSYSDFGQNVQAPDPLSSSPLAVAMYGDPNAQQDAQQDKADYGYTAPLQAAMSPPSPGIDPTARQDSRQDYQQYGYSPPTSATFDMNSYLSRVRGLEGGAAGMSAQNGSATGQYQFQPPTWATVMKQNPNLGLTADGIHDAGQQEIAAQAMTNSNFSGLARNLGRDPTPAELYLAHQQGLGGATALLTANPNSLAASVVPAANIRGNGGNPHTATVGQFINTWANNYNNATPIGPPAQPSYATYSNPSQPYTLSIGTLQGNSNNPGFAQ